MMTTVDCVLVLELGSGAKLSLLMSVMGWWHKSECFGVGVGKWLLFWFVLVVTVERVQVAVADGREKRMKQRRKKK